MWYDVRRLYVFEGPKLFLLYIIDTFLDSNFTESRKTRFSQVSSPRGRPIYDLATKFQSQKSTHFYQKIVHKIMKKNDEKKIQMIYKSNRELFLSSKLWYMMSFHHVFLRMFFWSSLYVNLNYKMISGLSYSQTGYRK